MASSQSWYAFLASAFARSPGNGFQFTTVNPVSQSPQCRTMACTDLLAPAPDSAPLLLASTHVRAPKISEILANPRVQILWWFEDTKEQFRISGTATVIASPNRSDYQTYQAQKADLPLWFDCEAKRVETFKAMPGYISAYCRPPWGTPLRDTTPIAQWPKVFEPTEMSTEDERRNYETALSNFALIVVHPTVVDYRTAEERILFKKTDEGDWEGIDLVMP